jgi:hypothetical protein
MKSKAVAGIAFLMMKVLLETLTGRSSYSGGFRESNTLLIMISFFAKFQGRARRGDRAVTRQPIAAKAVTPANREVTCQAYGEVRSSPI